MRMSRIVMQLTYRNFCVAFLHRWPSMDEAVVSIPFKSTTKQNVHNLLLFSKLFYTT